MTENDQAQKDLSLTRTLVEKETKAVESGAATNAEKIAILPETALSGRPEWKMEGQQF